MKQNLRIIMLTLLCAVFHTAWGQTIVTDILDNGLIGNTGTSYSSWEDKQNVSNAVYAGNSAGNYSSIQLRSTDESGIVTTASGGKVKSITVEWEPHTLDGRTLEIFGKTESYNSTSDLYESEDQDEQMMNEIRGTLLGTIVKGESIKLEIDGEYENIGLRSERGSMYLTNILIEWETDYQPSKVSTPCFSPASGTSSIGSLEVSISCASENATIYYTTDDENWETYTESFMIMETTTVKAYAIEDGFENSEIATATYTIWSDDIGNDGYFDFTHGLNYGTGLTPNSYDNYIETPYTWTAGDVTLETSGKYRYWLRSQGDGQLRIGYDNNSTLTLSVPEGMVITQIIFDAGYFHLSPDVGTMEEEKIWTGRWPTVKFTATQTTEINSIEVIYEYGEGDKSDPLLSIEDVDLYYYDTAILELSTRSDGNISISYTPQNVVAITYDEGFNNYIVSRCDDADYEGSVTVTVQQEGTDKYNESSDVQFAINVLKKSNWARAELEDLTQDDVIVIVGTNGDGSYAMSNDNGSRSAPATVVVESEDDQLISPVPNNIGWRISRDADGHYKFKTDNNQEKWLYSLDSNNGLRVGGRDENNTFDFEDNYLFNTVSERYVGIYNSQDWRCYKDIEGNIADQIFTFYKRIDSEPVEVTFVKKAEGYSTLFYGHRNLAIPDGVKAYTYKVDEKGKAVETEYEKIIPKGSAVILELENKDLLTSDGYLVTFTTTIASEDAHTDNMLYGFDESGHQSIGPDDTKEYLFYSLSLNKDRDEGSIGFYWNQPNGEAFEMPAHRAYLAVEKTEGTQPVSSFTFSDMGTGINGVIAEEQSVGDIYTLMGVRVNSNSLQKGIYIVNGKKVIIR
jgi:hypothetical protein